ncbi:hypothetical protein ACNKHK_28360 [Shigella flexneri]
MRRWTVETGFSGRDVTRALLVMLNTEHGNGLGRRLASFFQRGSGSEQIFHKRGVLLHHTIHLGNGQPT